MGFCGGKLAKELNLTTQDAEFNPAIHEFTEPLVGGELLEEFFDAVGSHETADGSSTMNIGQFVIGAVPMRMIRMHASASGVSADLVLTGDAAGVHGIQGR